VLAPLVATLVVLELVRVIAHRRQKVRRWEVAGAVVRRCVRPAWFVAAVIVAELTFVHDVNRDSRDSLSHSLAIALIIGVTWLGVELVYAMSRRPAQRSSQVAHRTPFREMDKGDIGADGRLPGDPRCSTSPVRNCLPTPRRSRPLANSSTT